MIRMPERNLLRRKTNFILRSHVFGVSECASWQQSSKTHSTHLKSRPSVRPFVDPAECAFLFCKWCTNHSHTCLFIARVCKRKSECVSARARALHHISVCLCMFWIMDTIKIFHRITQLFSWSVLSALFSLPLILAQTPIPDYPAKRFTYTHAAQDSIRNPFGHWIFRNGKESRFFSLSHSLSFDGIIKIFFHNLIYEKCHARKHAQAHII